MKHLSKLNPSTPIVQLESMISTISTESFNLLDMSNRGKAFLSSVVDNSFSAITKALHEFDSFSLKSAVNEFLVYSKLTKYNDVMRLRVPCPEGFRGNVADYAGALSVSVDSALLVYSDILLPLEEFLANLVSKPGYAKDTRIHLKFLQSATNTRLKDIKRLQEFFSASSNSSSIFSDLYKNMNEFENTYTLIKDLQNKIESINREEIIQKINRIGDLVDHLKKSVVSGELDGMSKIVLNELATGVYEAAKQVEQLSAITFAVYVLSNNMNDTVKLF